MPRPPSFSPPAAAASGYNGRIHADARNTPPPQEVPAVDMPLVAPLRQAAPQPAVADVAAEVRRAWLGSRLRERIPKGARVAVAVGSRGIANLQTIVKATL